MPISGNSSAIITAESPNQSSIDMILPLGRLTRVRSSAPNARVYHSAARSASWTTMCGVIAWNPAGIAWTALSATIVLLGGLTRRPAQGLTGGPSPHGRSSVAVPRPDRGLGNGGMEDRLARPRQRSTVAKARTVGLG